MQMGTVSQIKGLDSSSDGWRRLEFELYGLLWRRSWLILGSVYQKREENSGRGRLNPHWRISDCVWFFVAVWMLFFSFPLFHGILFSGFYQQTSMHWREEADSCRARSASCKRLRRVRVWASFPISGECRGANRAGKEEWKENRRGEYR